MPLASGTSLGPYQIDDAVRVAAWVRSTAPEIVLHHE